LKQTGGRRRIVGDPWTLPPETPEPKMILKAPWNERNGRFSTLKAIVFAGLFAPAAWLAFELMTGMLFPKPVTELIHGAGLWTVRLLLLSLLVTPLRRFARWPKLIAVRRMVGVAAFAYALAHLSLYVVDQSYDVLHVGSEIVRRFYLTIGFAALIGLATLAATSTDAMIRRLGAPAWNRLHKLVYLIAPLALLHFFLQAKANVAEPAMMAGLYFLMMLTRLLKRFGWPQWATALAAALLAAPATALAEASWYALVRHIPFGRVWDANFSLLLAPRPSWLVALAGVALVVVALVRAERARGRAPALAAAK
jgi:sulfoxide reductase heme-binding subunit YedZ